MTEEVVPQTPMTPLMTADTNRKDSRAQGDVSIRQYPVIIDEVEDRL